MRSQGKGILGGGRLDHVSDFYTSRWGVGGGTKTRTKPGSGSPGWSWVLEVRDFRDDEE